MKRFSTGIVLAFILTIASIVGIHLWQANQAAKKFAELKMMTTREQVADNLIVELERYRRISASFRKLTEDEIKTAKNRELNSTAIALQQFAKLDPLPAEQALADDVSRKFSELRTVSAAQEPTLFSRDVYVREVVRNLHDGMIHSLLKLRESASERAAQVEGALSGESKRYSGILGFIAVVALGLMGLLLMSQYVAFALPMKKLRSRLKALREGKFASPNDHKPSGLTGTYGEIEHALLELASAVDSHRKERQQFFKAVATDLRSPLISLQSGATLVAQGGSPDKIHTGTEIVKRSLFRVTRTLEDLKDILDTDSSKIALEERLVDIGELVAGCSNMLGGKETDHPVTFQVPSDPIWVMVDPRKFERVIVNLCSRLMRYIPTGTVISINADRHKTGAFRGLEIRISDQARDEAQVKAPTGPELGLLRHWISEIGFGMKISQQIIEAHGGTVTAAGLSGSGIEFRIRIPEARLVQSLAPVNDVFRGTSLFESTRVKTMLTDQAVNLGT